MVDEDEHYSHHNNQREHSEQKDIHSLGVLLGPVLVCAINADHWPTRYILVAHIDPSRVVLMRPILFAAAEYTTPTLAILIRVRLACCTHLFATAYFSTDQLLFADEASIPVAF